jgi:hypothetical protein
VEPAVAEGYTLHAVVDPAGKPIRPPPWFLAAVEQGSTAGGQTALSEPCRLLVSGNEAIALAALDGHVAFAVRLSRHTFDRDP